MIIPELVTILSGLKPEGLLRRRAARDLDGGDDLTRDVKLAISATQLEQVDLTWSSISSAPKHKLVAIV